MEATLKLGAPGADPFFGVGPEYGGDPFISGTLKLTGSGIQIKNSPPPPIDYTL